MTILPPLRLGLHLRRIRCGRRVRRLHQRLRRQLLGIVRRVQKHLRGCVEVG